MRSPEGSAADRSGADSFTRWRVALATSFANRRHQSKSANGAATRRQPLRVSRNTSPGRLRHSSVTSGSASSGRSASRVRSSADPPGTAPRRESGLAGCGAKLIDGPEVEVACHQHLDAVAVVLDHRRHDGNGVFEHLGENVL